MASKFEMDREMGRGWSTGVGNRGLDMKLKKCDVRLTKEESSELDRLAELNGATRSDIMRKALKDFIKFNTMEE